MGKVILCEKQQAIIPYMFVNTKVEVYSYEELCFYIYHNVALLHKEQFRTRFITWLHTELGMNELADKIQNRMDADAALNTILVDILSAGSYYDTAEIKQFVDKQELLSLLPPEERIKLKADSFLMYKRVLKAVSLYDDILRKEDTLEDKRFVGDVYHNKGVALAKNMELSKAKLCFLEAFNRNQKQGSLEAFIMLRILEEPKDEASREVIWKEAEAFGMDEADYNRIIMLVEDAVDDSKSTAVYKRYEKAIYNMNHGDLEAFNQRVDMLLNQWKEEFREQVI